MQCRTCNREMINRCKKFLHFISLLRKFSFKPGLCNTDLRVHRRWTIFTLVDRLRPRRCDANRPPSLPHSVRAPCLYTGGIALSHGTIPREVARRNENTRVEFLARARQRKFTTSVRPRAEFRVRALCPSRAASPYKESRAKAAAGGLSSATDKSYCRARRLYWLMLHSSRSDAVRHQTGFVRQRAGCDATRMLRRRCVGERRTRVTYNPTR